MSTKHVFQSPDGLVLKSLRGAVALNPALRLHAPSKSVYVASAVSHSVALISGGGAGHEPAHAGYTGQGMLAACVSGDIFASPSAAQILSAILLAARSSDHPHDVLAVINNYTGDRLNFGLAIEQARARGLRVESVVVADDVALLGNSNGSLVGPRGLAGNILVCKVLGAAAARGRSLAQVKALGDATVASLASIGVGLEHCHVPGRDVDGRSDMGKDECEVGLGLHNEAGAKREKLGSGEELVSEMVNMVLQSRGEGKEAFVRRGDAIVLFVNNLGGVSQLEMGAVVDEVLQQLNASSIDPVRVYLSSYMTSLNAPGFSVHILNLSGVSRHLSAQPSAQLQDTPTFSAAYDTDGKLDFNSVHVLLQLLDDPTDAAAWIGVRTHWAEPLPPSPTFVIRDRAQEERDAEHLLHLLTSTTATAASGGSASTSSSSATPSTWWRAQDISPATVVHGLRGAATAILRAETELTRFDTVAGDGDCGETFARGARAMLAALDKNDSLGEVAVREVGPADVVARVGLVLEGSMGGTIGALSALFFAAWSRALRESDTSAGDALGRALTAMRAYTPAQPGDRTVMDALYPLAVALDGGAGMDAGVAAAWAGAHSTRGMEARLGRAVYVGKGVEGDGEGERRAGVPDPGAWGVAVAMEGFWEGMKGGV